MAGKRKSYKYKFSTRSLPKNGRLRVLALIALIFEKVNSAGGEGGSITLPCGESASARRSLLRTIVRPNQLVQPIAIYLSRFGFRVWEG